jgi:Family of unknown function (DUF5678)
LVNFPVRNYRFSKKRKRSADDRIFVQQTNVRANVRGGARYLEQEWIKQHKAEYLGAWVALEGTRLLAHGSSAFEVLTAAKAKGSEQPLVVHIPLEPELPFGGW